MTTEKPVKNQKTGQKTGLMFESAIANTVFVLAFVWYFFVWFIVYALLGTVGMAAVCWAYGVPFDVHLLWLSLFAGILGILVEGKMFND